jgi:hypothetical protein
MDVIHNIKIPSVHIGSVDPTTDTSLAPSGEGGQPTPITYLTQWKIVGNSEVHDNEIWSCGEPRTYNITLYDSTKELLDGFLPQSGSYPTTNSGYPNAKYYVFNVKAGYVVRTQGFTNGHIRMRLIDNNAVISDISRQNDEYYNSTWDAFYGNTGNITFKKNCQVGLMFLNTPSLPIEDGSVLASYFRYHILVQPLGGSIADIVLDAPLRKFNDVADTIEFPSGTEGKALVTRNLCSVDLGDLDWIYRNDVGSGIFAVELLDRAYNEKEQILIPQPYTFIGTVDSVQSFRVTAKNMNAALYYNTAPQYSMYRYLYIRNNNYTNSNDFKLSVTGLYIIYELATPTTELVDAPQIQEADSYTCVISQGAKAVEWSSFETE